MDFKIPLPTLFELSLASISCHFINRRLTSHIQKHEVSSRDHRLPRNFESWPQFHAEIKEDMLSLTLPKFLAEELWDMQRQIFDRLWEWIEFSNNEDVCRNTFQPSIAKVDRLRLTGLGELDRTAMLGSCIDRGFADQHSMADYWFKLASKWGLDAQATRLWEMMSPEHRAEMRHTTSPLVAYQVERLDSLALSESLVTPLLTAYDSNLSMEANLLQWCMDNNCKEAFEQFFKKLSEEERRQQAYSAISAVDILNASMLCRVLYHLSLSQQLAVLRVQTVHSLSGLLHWPYDRFFIPCYELVAKYVDAHHFPRLFSNIVTKIPNTDVARERLQRILRHFWQITPYFLKEAIFEDRFGTKLFISQLAHLAQFGDDETFELISADVYRITNLVVPRDYVSMLIAFCPHML